MKLSTYFSLSGVLLREDFMTSGVFVLSSFPDVATVGVVVVVDILWFLVLSLFQRQVLVIDKPRPASNVQQIPFIELMQRENTHLFHVNVGVHTK